MQKIKPFIWLKENGKEALDFYTGLFPNSKVVEITPITGAPGPAGQFVANFELMGEPFALIQGGDNEMIKAAGPLSFVASCDTQEEIDTLWDAFSQGGKPVMCGWITDRFGVVWQVVPAKMNELMSGEPEKVKRVTEAMLKMVKLDIPTLEAAARG